MSLDIRARRAADGVHASVTGVNPMATLEDLKHTHDSRRRAGTVAAVVSLLVVVAGGAWYAASSRTVAQQDDSRPVQIVTPTPSDPRQIVGANLAPPISARVPARWTVDNDGDALWLSHPSGASFEVSKPIILALDPLGQKTIKAPTDYHSWLLRHRWVRVENDRPVMVDGIATYITTYRIDPSLDPARIGLIDLVSDSTDFSGLKPGDRIVDVAIPLRRTTGGDPFAGGYRLLRHHVPATGEGIARGQAIESGIADFLASLQLP
jgi:hypothetical protein